MNCLCMLLICHLRKSIKKKPANHLICRLLRSFDTIFCDPAGIRTQDHYIKSVMLYQLSYGIVPFLKDCKGRKKNHILLMYTQ